MRSSFDVVATVVLSCLLLAMTCTSSPLPSLNSILHRSPPTPTSKPSHLSASLPHIRPAPSARKFNSTAVNALIDSYTARMTDPDLATLFSNCLPCTLDTTVKSYTPSTPTSPPDSYIITGDIDAEWLRDSTNQVLPYMSLLRTDPPLSDLVCGLIRRQSRNIIHDPYANSFNPNATGVGHQDDRRKPKMTAEVFEGKWELDSLAAAMKLAWHYYNATQDSACFLNDNTWGQAIKVRITTSHSHSSTCRLSFAVSPADSFFLHSPLSLSGDHCHHHHPTADHSPSRHQRLFLPARDHSSHRLPHVGRSGQHRPSYWHVQVSIPPLR